MLAIAPQKVKTYHSRDTRGRANKIGQVRRLETRKVNVARHHVLGELADVDEDHQHHRAEQQKLGCGISSRGYARKHTEPNREETQHLEDVVVAGGRVDYWFRNSVSSLDALHQHSRR